MLVFTMDEPSSEGAPPPGPELGPTPTRPFPLGPGELSPVDGERFPPTLNFDV